MVHGSAAARGVGVGKFLAVFVALVGLGAAPAACLPEGGPGIGLRWVEGRDISALALPSGPGASNFVVFGRTVRDAINPPDAVQRSYDLYAVDRPNGPPQRVAQKIAYWGNGPFVWDARDGLWTLQLGPTVADLTAFDLRYVNLASGATSSLGMAGQIDADGEGKTIIIGRSAGQAEARDLDYHIQALGNGVSEFTFVGPSLFFTGPAGLHQLALPPLVPPRPLVDRARDFWPVPGHQDEQLLVVDVDVSSDAADPYPARQIGILRGADPTPGFAVLAEGHFLAAPALADEGDRIGLLDRTADPHQVSIRVVDLQTGVEQAITLLAPDPSAANGGPPGTRSTTFAAVFRPGTPELWVFAGERLMAIFTSGPGGPQAVMLDPTDRRMARQGGFLRALLPRRDVFTSDGQFWIFREAGRLWAGDANLPTGPGALDLGGQSPTMNADFSETAAGHRLVFFSDQSQDRDLRLADLTTRQTVVLANNVGQAEQGAGRIIAIVDKLSGDAAPGRLVSIDLASGESTRLADNVTTFRLARVCPSCDPTATGVGLQYLVQARFPFRYDGLWKATLP